MPEARIRPVVQLALCELVDEFSSGGVTFDPNAHEARFRRVYGAWAAWPADAQFAIHVLGWLHGPMFRHHDLRMCMIGPSPAFDRAALEVANMTNAGHSGVVAIHDRAARALRNAWAVLAWNRKPEVLYYPFSLC